jgi:hypothetical protein
LKPVILETAGCELPDVLFDHVTSALNISKPVDIAAVSLPHVPNGSVSWCLRTKFQWRLFGSPKVTPELAAGVSNDVTKVAPIVPPEDDRLII